MLSTLSLTCFSPQVTDMAADTTFSFLELDVDTGARKPVVLTAVDEAPVVIKRDMPIVEYKVRGETGRRRF